MREKYYLGLDIGTNSVGYAVSDEDYRLLKHKGEPMWGVQTFEEGKTSAERRSFRVSRRRIDRRKQRIALLNDIFAADIGKIDPKFFVRRAQSSLFRDEADDDFTVFSDSDYTDREYHRDYPTIHHLIIELMKNKEPHDIRLVYLACAWLISHRGHFLYDVPSDDISSLTNFSSVYDDFTAFFKERDTVMPWSNDVPADSIKGILTMKAGVRGKQEAFIKRFFDGKNPPKTISDEYEYQYNPALLVNLLCGGSVKAHLLFPERDYEDFGSISLSMDDDLFAEIITNLGEDGDLLVRMRAMADCALLITTTNGKDSLSEAKVEIYEQHKNDLTRLKAFVKKYIPDEYNAIFREAVADNYVAYSHNLKNCKDAQTGKFKSANAEAFLKFLQKKVDKITPDKEDAAFYDDMMHRIEARSFLPKQKTVDNRVIPQQLYRHELKLILDNAESYIPMLAGKDESGLTTKEKILSIFDFRIPYFVGPLCGYKNENYWMVRKASGKIYPWNFKDMVDYDKSEEAFIRRMTKSCTYLADEPVLPAKSLLYTRFTVLNEINNLKVNGTPISVDAKQRLFNELFMQNGKATFSQVKNWLKINGLAKNGDDISGVDVKINASLPTYKQFRRLMDSGTLDTSDVEDIIYHASFCEERGRLLSWLAKEYPRISDEDRKYISRLNLKDFGRLSGTLLDGIIGCDKKTGEAFTIIEALWKTNQNFMQLLSSKYDFKEKIEEFNKEYYAGRQKTLEERLEDMYISNSAKRPIFRTMAICSDIVKATGCQPERIFIRMAKGPSPEQNGKSKSRLEQIKELYKKIKDPNIPELKKHLDDFGPMADNKLQEDRMYLYFLQLGKCAYTGNSIRFERISTTEYSIDHIYPKSLVKDESLLNNKVLVEYEVNKAKDNSYPVPEEFRTKMVPVWEYWKKLGLITEEKYRRLIRADGFSDEEKMGFINRQLVETRQSTKAVAEILKEKYPQAEIVHVNAGLISEFRQENGLVKSRLVNNLHSAKDAYLDIVCGNVYYSRFSLKWFNKNEYSLNPRAVYNYPVKCGETTVWRGESDIAKVCAVLQKNAVHTTRFAFTRKGGLFHQQPLKAGSNLVPLKAGKDTLRYGGYDSPTASFFSLVKYVTEKKTDIIFMPVELRFAENFLSDSEFAKKYARDTVSSIINKPISDAEILLEGRPLKIGTIVLADGLRLAINGKSNCGKAVVVSLAMPLILSDSEQRYVKALETFSLKRRNNPAILPDAEHDHITVEKNISLFDVLSLKMGRAPYLKCPGNRVEDIISGREKFSALDIPQQVHVLLSIITWFSSASTVMDLSLIGGSKNAGSKAPSSNLSSWKKTFDSVQIVDMSPSGLFETKSENLLSLF